MSNIQPLIVEINGQKIEILERFNSSERENYGRPYYFNLDIYCAAIEMMICSDELQSALWMLDNPPAWFRLYYPERLAEMRKTIYRQTYDQHEYSTDDDEANCTREFGESQWLTGYTYPRAEIIMEELKRLNSEGRTPWIFDLGCSHGNLPLGLLRSGMRFQYLGYALNHRIEKKVKEWVGETWCDRPNPDQEKILFCSEVLEHCMNPHDIVHTAHKIGVKFDQIILSTPLGCLFQGLPDWRTRRMGHVRGWTPQEFLDFANKGFPGFEWKLYPEFSMVLHGRRK